MSNRSRVLQDLLNKLYEDWDIPDSIVVGSDHSYDCRCMTCLNWWRMMGPNPETGKYGPFTEEEIKSGKIEE